ncbi:hypothetical protein [uncultured Sphingomonas sp.]|uniref:hypothetical protein n=1 Tax=uncultured Sphingomonas sp. TaxID=158754 RepID=UPI0025F9A7FC|nr:hypothetical protein [uncultured Sphingomonas sp.]
MTLRFVGGAILLIVLALLALWGWAALMLHRLPLSRAVDQGACADTTHVQLEPLTPPGSRELFRASAACRAQVVTTLRAAANYTCRSDAVLTVCEHPLNAPDSSTYVRAIVGHDHVLLETIPT